MPTEFKTNATNINASNPMPPTTVAMNTGDGLEDLDGSTARDANRSSDGAAADVNRSSVISF